LTGTNTYSGGTIIDAGVLQLGNGETTGNILGNVVDNATLAFDHSDVFTFGGVISGTGAVQQTGAGTTVLTGKNTYTGGTTISAGTLQLGTGDATGSITGNVSDNGILVFDRSDIYTFAGLISGAGSVEQIGTGTTVLIRNNTYSGGTTINKGTFQLGGAGTTGSIIGNVSDNGILAFDRSDIYTFGGLISGTGSVQQIGTGITVLTGNNTYTGGTIINAGTLQLGEDGTSGSITGNVTDNGTLIFSRSDSLSFGGAISGTGSMIKRGGGTLLLNGRNSYTGTTTVSTGTLQAGSVDALSPGSAFTVNSGATLDLNGFNGTLGSLSGSGLVTNSGGLNLSANATLNAGANNSSTTFSGILQDQNRATLALTKVGIGILTLTGTNTDTGETTVEAGGLIVDGSIASSETQVNQTGLLGGNGFLGGNLLNHGVVNPGDAPGTLTVLGNYTQSATGTLRIEVSGLFPGQYDVLVVDGHASLAGTLQLVALNGFKLQVGNQNHFPHRESRRERRIHQRPKSIYQQYHREGKRDHARQRCRDPRNPRRFCDCCL
jgi:fibronectin-binding autotransporter adhesin